MNEPNFYAVRVCAELFDVPMLATDLLDGTVRLEKAGIVVIGATVAQAKAEWGRQFAAIIRQPKT